MLDNSVSIVLIGVDNKLISREFSFMRSFLFLTKEGTTYPPSSPTDNSGIDNLQVLGFEEGSDENEAFNNLLAGNEELKRLGFNEVICMELKHKEYFRQARYFYLNHEEDAPEV